MAVNRDLLKRSLSGASTYLKASTAQQDLLDSKSISDYSMNSANFGSGKAGNVGLFAQLGTAGIGAYGQYKARQKIEDAEVASQQAFASQFPQYAELASQLSPETRQAYTVEAMKSSLKGNEPLSGVAKLESDRRNGLISDSQYKAAFNKETRIASGEGGSEKAPQGYRFLADGSLEAIPGGPAGKLSAESAGKVALIKQGENDINRFRDMISEKDEKGNITGYKRGKLEALAIYGQPGARNEYSTLYNAVNARLRLESGAAVPEAEVKRALNTFAPNPTDSDETINSKLTRMNEFFSLAKEEIGQGRGAQNSKPTDPSPTNNQPAIAEGTVIKNKAGQTLVAKGGQWVKP